MYVVGGAGAQIGAEVGACKALEYLIENDTKHGVKRMFSCG